MSGSQIAELSAKIAANTAKVGQYYVDNRIPQPSFDRNAPLTSSVPPEAADIEAARQAVIHDCEELRTLMLGPTEFVADIGFTPSQLVPLRGITRWGLARKVPIDGEITFEELATATNIGEAHLRRLLRLAMTQHIFHEPRPGVVAHTPASRVLAEDELLHQWISWCMQEAWTSAYHTCNAMEKWPGSGEPNQTGFALAHGEKAMFEYLSEHADSQKRFADMLRFFARATTPGLAPQYIVNGYPWASLPAGATIVDMGGSHGAFSLAIAREFPSLKFVVQDVDETVIREAEARKPADLADRVQYMHHDFFQPQPVCGDVYFLRAILHNWSDTYAVRILRNLIPVLNPGTKIIVCDLLIPEPGTIPSQQDRLLRTTNIIMTTCFNASDREMAEMANVFKEASPNFDFKGGKQPAGSTMCIFEAEWTGDGKQLPKHSL